MSNVVELDKFRPRAPAPTQPKTQRRKPRPKESLDVLHSEAMLHASYHGPNAYSKFLVKHGQRPAPDEATSIGTLLGYRVRGSDGKLYPALTKEQKEARKVERERRRAEDKRMQQELNLHAAVTFLARNTEDPAGIAASLRKDHTIIAEQIDRDLEIALDWLLTFHRAWTTPPGPRPVE